MKIDASVGNKPADVFKTFPEFSKLTLADRTKYEALIRDLPPFSEYSFPTLMNWWNSLDSCAVSMLNGNLIISYWIPGVERVTGISLVGVNEVDTSICSLLDHLKARGEKPRLVHVPEFVISHMEHPEMFLYTSERDTDEYVLATDRFYPLSHGTDFRCRRIDNFLRSIKGSDVTLMSLDLSREENLFRLINSVNSWPKEGTLNSTVQHSDDGLMVAVNQADIIGTENLCLLIDGKIHAFILYTQPADKRYVIFSHYRASHALPHLLDYMIYRVAEWFAARDVQYMNIDSDLGMPMLRTMKLGLGPDTYFRKYTVKPAV